MRRSNVRSFPVQEGGPGIVPPIQFQLNKYFRKNNFNLPVFTQKINFSQNGVCLSIFAFFFLKNITLNEKILSSFFYYYFTWH